MPLGEFVPYFQINVNYDEKKSPSFFQLVALNKSFKTFIDSILIPAWRLRIGILTYFHLYITFALVLINSKKL